jgi:hypothetical protein
MGAGRGKRRMQIDPITAISGLWQMGITDQLVAQTKNPDACKD